MHMPKLDAPQVLKDFGEMRESSFAIDVGRDAYDMLWCNNGCNCVQVLIFKEALMYVLFLRTDGNNYHTDDR
tara:strand:+ start:363 stop:578 length:216 start_codon:yes stop_codon:yes gene_type:complete